MASIFGFGGSSTVINVKLNGEENRPKGRLISSDPNSALVGIYSGQVFRKFYYSKNKPFDFIIYHLIRNYHIIGSSHWYRRSCYRPREKS